MTIFTAGPLGGFSWSTPANYVIDKCQRMIEFICTLYKCKACRFFTLPDNTEVIKFSD